MTTTIKRVERNARGIARVVETTLSPLEEVAYKTWEQIKKQLPEAPAHCPCPECAGQPPTLHVHMDLAAIDPTGALNGGAVADEVIRLAGTERTRWAQWTGLALSVQCISAEPEAPAPLAVVRPP